MKTYQIKIFSSSSTEDLEKQFNEWCQKMKYEEGFNVWKTNFSVSSSQEQPDYFFCLTALFTQNNLH
jgi:hypothetical protein